MKRTLILLVLSLLFIGCTKTPITGRSQLIMMDHNEEMQLGLEASQKILQQSKQSHDKRATDTVRRIGNNIAEVTNKDYNTTDYQWEFYLIENNQQANAFCLPGGKVFVYTGIFKYIENEAELATVMGHEIAHALAKHGAERSTRTTLAKVGRGIMKVLTEANNKLSRTEKDYYHKLDDKILVEWVLLPHSRTQEYEADTIGLVLSAKAGYDPRAALSFWKKFSQSSHHVPEYLSTHPTPTNRIEKLQELIPQVLPYYEQSPKRETQKVEQVQPILPTLIPFFKK